MSHSSGSSLLHLHRPVRLDTDAQTGNESAYQSAAESIASSPSSSILHSSTVFFPARPRAGPSMKIDTLSTSPIRLERPVSMRRKSSQTTSSAVTTPGTSYEAVECVDLLKSVKTPFPYAKNRNEWQRDEDSALCNHPFCSTMFGTMLGPRRHHCRLCGLIYCHSHSLGRMPLQTTDAYGQPTVKALRVCDSCVGPEADCTPKRRTSSATDVSAVPSLSSSGVSAVDELIVDPESRLVPMTRSLSSSAVAEVQPELAPVASWMDRSGILSLYPLAAKASHAPRGSDVRCAAGPLFAPTLSERRNATEKRIERQRKLKANKSFASIAWTSGSLSDDDTDIIYAGRTGSDNDHGRSRPEVWSTF